MLLIGNNGELFVYLRLLQGKVGYSFFLVYVSVFAVFFFSFFFFFFLCFFAVIAFCFCVSAIYQLFALQLSIRRENYKRNPKATTPPLLPTDTPN